MKIIVCLDENQGLLFNKRRQSRDRRIIEDILESTRGQRLYLSAFSAPLFAAFPGAVLVAEDFLSLAGAGDFCFVENLPVSPYLARIEAVIVYRWHRAYPADVYFDLPLGSPQWRCVEAAEFPGYSHEKLTKEVYLR